MKLISNLLNKVKDGGVKSPVDAYFLIEMKGLFSIALLKFNKGSREEFHSHAFDALTWFIKGELTELDLDCEPYRYSRSLLPKVTLKSKMHRVVASEDSWCLTLRGPWSDLWSEYDEKLDKTTLFTHGRDIVNVRSGK